MGEMSETIYVEEILGISILREMIKKPFNAWNMQTKNQGAQYLKITKKSLLFEFSNIVMYIRHQIESNSDPLTIFYFTDEYSSFNGFNHTKNCEMNIHFRNFCGPLDANRL